MNSFGAPSRELSLLQSLNEALMLLSEGLDLCVRAKKLDEAMSAALVAGNVGTLERPWGGAGTRCMTPAMWVQDAYDAALNEWQSRATEALYRLAPFADHLPPPSGITALLKLAHQQASESQARDGARTNTQGDGGEDE